MSGGSKTTTEEESQSSGEFATNEATGFWNNAVVPEEYRDAWLSFTPTPGAMDPFVDGMTSAADRIGEATGRYAPINEELDEIGDYFGDASQRGSYTLESLKQRWPELYGEDPNVDAAQVGGVGDINATTGAAGMDAYRNPFEERVVGATLDDLSETQGRDRVTSQMQQSAAGAFGGGRHALREAQMTDDQARTRASVGAGIRSRGFDIAAGHGQTDAQRKLAAAGANQQTALQRAIQQARIQQAANTENARLTDSRQKFDVDAAYRGDDARDRAALGRAGILGGQAGMINDEASLSALEAGIQGAAGGLSTADHQMLLQWLNGGAPLIGQEGGAVGASTGTQSGESSGTSTTTESAGLFDWASLLASPFSITGTLPCWVAREVYGVDNPQWLEFRHWLLNYAPAWFRNAYLKYGERVAAFISNKPLLKRIIRSWMDTKVHLLETQPGFTCPVSTGVY